MSQPDLLVEDKAKVHSHLLGQCVIVCTCIYDSIEDQSLKASVHFFFMLQTAAYQGREVFKNVEYPSNRHNLDLRTLPRASDDEVLSVDVKIE